MGIFLRAMIDIMVVTITLPIRIIILLATYIYVTGCAIYYKELVWFSYPIDGMKKPIKIELYWIKNGNFDCFEETETES